MDPELRFAAHLLVVAGIANLVLSFALGWVLSAKRMKGPIEPHRWLLVAHEVAFQEGLMLIAIAFALRYAKLSGDLAAISAWLLVAASFFQDFSGILNWLKKTGDQFAEKSAGWLSASINAVLNSVGLGIVAYGVVVAALD